MADRVRELVAWQLFQMDQQKQKLQPTSPEYSPPGRLGGLSLPQSSNDTGSENTSVHEKPSQYGISPRQAKKALSLSLPDMRHAGRVPNGLTSPGELSLPPLVSPPPLDFRPMSPPLSVCSYTSFSSFVDDG